MSEIRNYVQNNTYLRFQVENVLSPKDTFLRHFKVVYKRVFEDDDLITKKTHIRRLGLGLKDASKTYSFVTQDFREPIRRLSDVQMSYGRRLSAVFQMSLCYLGIIDYL